MGHYYDCPKCGQEKCRCDRPDSTSAPGDKVLYGAGKEPLTGKKLVRIDRDELGLRLAETWALRGTCGRRQVGCVLVDPDGYQLSSGYNGPGAGQPHCLDTGRASDRACEGFSSSSGTGLSLCEAVHAEANALLRCPDVRSIRVCYVTVSPCLDCVKLLLNTSCERIVFREPYAHDEAASKRWLTSEPIYRFGHPGQSRVIRVRRSWELIRTDGTSLGRTLDGERVW